MTCDLYSIQNPSYEDCLFVKYGISENAQRRVVDLENASGCALWLIQTLTLDNRHEALDAESWIHAALAEYRQRGEWFKLPKSFDAADWLYRAMEALGFKRQAHNDRHPDYWRWKRVASINLSPAEAQFRLDAARWADARIAREENRASEGP